MPWWPRGWWPRRKTVPEVEWRDWAFGDTALEAVISPSPPVVQWIRVTLRANGVATAQVTGQVAYGPPHRQRFAVTAVEVPRQMVEASGVARGMELLLAQMKDVVDQKAASSAIECARVAIQRGEM